MKIHHIIFIALSLFILGSCSTKKNTPATRAYQNLNTRFNVYFNGITSYEEGLKNIEKANKEDYSAIIPMYPISKHDNANAAKSNMERTIEKCRKAIKLHSIKVKPDRNQKKWSDPAYQLWYKQEEFNPALKDAWLLLAKAEFHKADFLGSVGTFTYIARHYPNDKDLVARCQLWIARAYGEMGWIYEAEQVLSKLKQDDIKPKSIALFASVNADLLLKKKQYKEAIPFLELSLKKESDKVLKQRFNYLLAQLYNKTGNKVDAYKAFTEVIKLNPPYEMDFNARIYRAELNNQNVGDARKELNKMIKNPNNKDYLDQLNYAIAKTYLQQRDTAKAIVYFDRSIAESTRNGFDKALTLITLGDLYYNKQKYIKAQPCYDEAAKIITVDNEDYDRVSKRAETLSELLVQYEIVVLQDSLQALAALPEKQRIAVVDKIIEKLIADEKAAAEADKAKTQAQLNSIDDMENMAPLGMPVGAAGEWYFYNVSTMKTGQAQFTKKWGRRKLEDNWRRTNKATTMFAEETISTETADPNISGAEGAVGTETDAPKAAEVTDNKTPEFYLQQIPLTAAQIALSNTDIANALFNMGMIYKDKVEDFPMAIKTFEEFTRRFPSDDRKVEAYFQSYMLESKRENDAEANIYRTKLISEFPKSKYVEVLSQPDYFKRMMRMYREQDSIYGLTYEAYNASKYGVVKQHVDYIQQNYPLSTLMPKFQFLSALSIGKTEKPEKFEIALNALVTKYPESDVSAMSKDILALIKQGREAKTGSSHGTLLTRRDEAIKVIAEPEIERQYSKEKAGKHRLLFITEAKAEGLNKLLYNIAAYNFTRFMVKDFDLVVGKLDSVQNTLSITNFESYDETEWYVNSISNDASLTALLAELSVKTVVISEENFGMMRTVFGLDEYQKFQALNLTSKAGKNTAIAPKPESLAMKTDLPNKATQSTASVANSKIATTQTSPSKPITGTSNNTTTVAPTQTQVTAKPKPVDDVPLFKNLFAYRANEPHYVSLVVISGTVDFDKIKATYDAYNAQNYAMLNLKINMETVGKMQVVIIGSFADANIAKSYLFRMVKETSLTESLKGLNYRNVLGSQNNLNIMMQQNAMNTYFEFMQEYYLK